MGFSEEMRRDRLVFYEKDINEINDIIATFIESSQAACVLMIDKDGHMVTKRGYTTLLNTDSIGALVAGSFASTRELAKQLGEKEFSVLFHEGENENLFISTVGDRALLVIIFDDRTTVGIIRAYSEKLVESVKGVLIKAQDHFDKTGETEGVSEDFKKDASNQVEDFFNED